MTQTEKMKRRQTLLLAIVRAPDKLISYSEACHLVGMPFEKFAQANSDLLLYQHDDNRVGIMRRPSRSPLLRHNDTNGIGGHNAAKY